MQHSRRVWPTPEEGEMMQIQRCHMDLIKETKEYI